jgi:hypothetical protein
MLLIRCDDGIETIPYDLRVAEALKEVIPECCATALLLGYSTTL